MVRRFVCDRLAQVLLTALASLSTPEQRSELRVEGGEPGGHPIDVFRCHVASLLML